jgi:hypothetical protein
MDAIPELTKIGEIKRKQFELKSIIEKCKDNLRTIPESRPDLVRAFYEALVFAQERLIETKDDELNTLGELMGKCVEHL